MSILPVDEITQGIAEFEMGFQQQQEQLGGNVNIQLLRQKAHLKLVHTCAHAVYFVGMANRLRRCADELRNGLVVRNKHNTSLMANEFKRKPGLQVGIIGAGRLGKHLARCLLEFADVSPAELHLSTRQPDALIELNQLGVKCFFDNARIASSVNILFLCVLPNQLPHVIEELKKSLHEQCIIYSFVTSVTCLSLRNSLLKSESRRFVIKAELTLTKNLDKFHARLGETWNFSASVLDCLRNINLIAMTNPFLNEEGLSQKTQ
jgi:hypothetical protein